MQEPQGKEILSRKPVVVVGNGRYHTEDSGKGQGFKGVILKITWRRILRINWRDPVPGQGGVEDGSPPPWRSEA
jgi:hypothetical protein